MLKVRYNSYAGYTENNLFRKKSRTCEDPANGAMTTIG